MISVISPSHRRRAARGLALAGVAAAALSAPLSQARASDVYWSLGLYGPGVSIGASNAPAVVHRPPVYYHPPPVQFHSPYVYPRPAAVMVHPPGYHRPPVVVLAPPVAVQGWGYGSHWDDRRDRRRDRWDDRHDHRDDHRRGHRDRDRDDEWYGYDRR